MISWTPGLPWQVLKKVRDTGALSSLLFTSSLDYNKLLTLLPPTSPQIAEIQRTVRSLKPRVEIAQKRETGEMMDKLKGLGNSVLGMFPLS